MCAAYQFEMGYDLTISRDAICQRVLSLNPCWESMVESRKVWLVLFVDNNINVSRNNSPNNISSSWLLSLSIKNLCVATTTKRQGLRPSSWMSNCLEHHRLWPGGQWLHWCTFSSAGPQLSLAWPGMAWLGSARLGSAWPPARHGLAWLGSDGPAQLGLARIWSSRLGSDQ